MNNNDSVIVVMGGDKLFLEQKKNVCSYFQSWTYGLLARGVRKVIRKIHFDFVETLFYGDWTKRIKNSSMIILFDSNGEYSERIPKYIKKMNKNIKVIFWYWNPIISFGNEIISNDYIDEVWTYNCFDAKKYNLKYNTQFYLPYSMKEPKETENDLIFLGKNKGRMEILNKIRSDATRQGLRCNFHVVRTRDDVVSYSDYVQTILSSRCIVDLVSGQSCGLTLRPLEALFYGKKLVTNYKDIKNYDFYDKSNVFIIGEDDMNKLADFINSPYKDIKQSVINYYSFNEWLSRFRNGGDIEQ